MSHAPHASTEADAESGHSGHGPLPALALGAIGVVFGDIGTSPLYSLQTVFSLDHNRVHADRPDTFGIMSLIFWSITLVVSIKYVALVMRADNEGEGGILALAAKILGEFRGNPKKVRIALMMAIIGAALFFGDSLITPAISVMSAMEGLVVKDAGLQRLVLPISVAILTVLFMIQRWGTAVVGRAFGPVMVVWFLTLAALGVPHIIKHPGIIGALSPHYAVLFIIDRPFVAFIALGAVVLTITGAEALYADMGHFGPRPIRLSWFALVFPALMLNYLGQCSMIIDNPATTANPFFLMAPSWAQIPLVILATMATVIASQAVISGAYSVASQAMRLGLFPRFTLRHTSAEEAGQIYLPGLNRILFVGVMVLILVFRSSARLATAYGLAVTGTLILTMLLFLLLAKEVWNWSWGVCITIGVVIGGLEFLFFAANVTKIISGGWLPVLIASFATALMIIWRDGARQLREARRAREGSLPEFLDALSSGLYPRVPGVAVFPHPSPETAPLAMRSNVEFNKVLHELCILITMVNANVPHIRHVNRVRIGDLSRLDQGIVQVSVKVGFMDSQDIPKALALLADTHPELGFDPDEALYFVSTIDARRDPERRGLRALTDSLFVSMSHNQAEAPQVFRLPPDRTVLMGEQIQM